ncbi:transcriptional regulator [Sinorhizobium sp. BJ1]|uniref:transcriptional regulator n=1 Tax=Sinorhizobium sp. BJ1 TaxID=2035455 RepID=UPI000BE9083D|nr:transcriptional regulator [Sinorhizobium sp. BJ1]PDT85812.1 transcriptional regulator [Sinorhizobium sp. BJ1]
MLAGKNIIVVAADHGLRRSVAFALEVEGYSTETYDTVQRAEASCREALCTILDDEILRSEPQAATQFLEKLGAKAILLVDGLSALKSSVDNDNTILTKPFTGADLLGVIDSLTEAAK